MSDKERLLLLLQLINVKGNIQHLVLYGWSYLDVLSAIDGLAATGYIEVADGITKLTSKGEKYFHTLNKELNHKGLYKYLKPDYYSKITQIQVDDVYLPPKHRINRVENKD